MKKTRHTVRCLLVLACAVGLAACASQAPVVTDGLTVAQVFQHAQDAVSRGDYQAGIAYYSVVPKNFPDDTAHGAWAEYEIAFLYHKLGKSDMALSLTNALLAKYAQDGDTLPPGPQILAQKLKTRLEAATTTKTTTTATAGS